MRYLRFLRFTLIHKWFVFIECLKLGIPWRGIKHDMGKLRPRAFMAYSRRFAAGNGYAAINDLAYLYVFASHLRRSEHHWQYWGYIRNSGEVRYLPMSDSARKEFLADLRASSRYYGTDVAEWYQEHKDEMHLHLDTRAWLECQLGLVSSANEDSKLKNIINRLLMRRHWAYLRYVLRHKWFVFVAGIKLGVPLHLLVFHDMSKFLPSEWFAYARTFYTLSGGHQYEPDGTGFNAAWLHHQKRNKHHWQYWMMTWDKGNTECLPMPNCYRKEMLADWRGAGRAITGDDNTAEWYTANKDNIKLHHDTRLWIEAQLGFDTVSDGKNAVPTDG